MALNNDEYLNNMSDLLGDIETYVRVDRDPTKKRINELHNMVLKWKNCEYISLANYRHLNCTDGILPRAYGLPKIHKPNCPLRVIISSIGTPLHPLATFLHKILVKSLPKANSYIKNSFDLVEKLTDNHIDGNNHRLISLDVISLFTNVPIELVVNSIEKRWIHIKNECALPKDEFLVVVRFILNSTFFF